MKTRHLALLGAFVPVAALISGCGGGGSGPSTRATPIPAPTFIGAPTGTGSFPTIAPSQATLVLPGGELGILELRGTGDSTGGATGTLRVLSGVTSPTSLAPGTYALGGVFSTTGAFNVASLNQNQTFSLSGDAATGGNPGSSYVVTRGTTSSAAQGLTNQNFTFASTPYQPSADLTFSNVRSLGTVDFSPGALIDFSPVTRSGPTAFTNTTGFGGFIHQQTANNPTSLAFISTNTRSNPANFNQSLDLSIQLDYTTPFTVGRTIDLSNPTASQSGNTVVASFPSSGIQYASNSGTIIVRDFAAERISLELRNVTLVTEFGSPTPGQFTGAVTLNGIFDATGVDNALISGNARLASKTLALSQARKAR